MADSPVRIELLETKPPADLGNSRANISIILERSSTVAAVCGTQDRNMDAKLFSGLLTQLSSILGSESLARRRETRRTLWDSRPEFLTPKEVRTARSDRTPHYWPVGAKQGPGGHLTRSHSQGSPRTPRALPQRIVADRFVEIPTFLRPAASIGCVQWRQPLP